MKHLNKILLLAILLILNLNIESSFAQYPMPSYTPQAPSSTPKPVPSLSSTPRPSSTPNPVPSSSSTPRPSSTPMPTITSTSTPMPTVTSTPSASETPSSTPACGNGIAEIGEGCDDGNLTNGDGCTSDCKTEKCGDGTINFSGRKEECDDGNKADDDNCKNDCTLNCPKICKDAKQGYKDGYSKPTGGSCNFPNETQTSCGKSGEVDKCCCVPCENNDRNCLCANGTDEQVYCYANKQLKGCCDDLDLSNVTIVRDKVNGSKCAANSCSTGITGDFLDTITGETDIRLAICGSGCSNDVCNTLRHEINHSKECENGNNYSDDSCEGQDNHIINQNSVYSKCLQDFESKAFPASCNFNCEWHKNSLKQYCCSFHKSVKNGKCLGGLSLDLCKSEFGLLDYSCK